MTGVFPWLKAGLALWYPCTDPRSRIGLVVPVAAIAVGQAEVRVIQPRLMGMIVCLKPAWLQVSVSLGARLGRALLGLLRAEPAASCRTLLMNACRCEIPDKSRH